MKLGKEEIQKIILGILLFFFVVYGYFVILLFPLFKRQDAYDKSIKGIGPETDKAKAQIQRAREMEEQAPTVAMTVRQVNAMIPEGSPVAWFPTRMTEFFKKQGIDKVTTRLTGDSTDKVLPGYRKLAWSIDVPKVGFVEFACAIAALENDEPLVEISSIQIDASREDVEFQHALLTVNNLVRDNVTKQ